jgi:hypothetical protein
MGRGHESRRRFLVVNVRADDVAAFVLERPGFAGSGSAGTSSRCSVKVSPGPAAGPPGRVSPMARARVRTARTSQQAWTRASLLILPVDSR